MAINDFKPFSTGEEANVLSQSEYEALDALTNGFQTGIARSEQLNKVWRQASTIASVVARFMADKSENDILDNGDLDTLQSNFLKALLNNSKMQLNDQYLQKEKNFSDLNNITQARDNLGLGDLAVKNGLSAAEVDAYPVTGGELSGEIWSKIADNYRIITNSIGAFWRFDGSNMYMMFTNKNDPNGGFNNLRPLSANSTTGDLTTHHHFHADGNVSAGLNVVANGNIQTGNGSARLETDGNVYGGVWGGYLSNYLANNWNNAVYNARRGGQQYQSGSGTGQGMTWECPAGCFLTGINTNVSDGRGMGVYFRRLQMMNKTGGWWEIGD